MGREKGFETMIRCWCSMRMVLTYFFISHMDYVISFRQVSRRKKSLADKLLEDKFSLLK